MEALFAMFRWMIVLIICVEPLVGSMKYLCNHFAEQICGYIFPLMQWLCVSLQYRATFCNTRKILHHARNWWQYKLLWGNDLVSHYNTKQHFGNTRKKFVPHRNFMANMQTNCNHVLFCGKKHFHVATNLTIITTRKNRGKIVN